jgi:hypothetical protein
MDDPRTTDGPEWDDAVDLTGELDDEGETLPVGEDDDEDDVRDNADRRYDQ